MTTNKDLLTADAQNRSWRTLLTGLAIDVTVAVALVLATTLATANEWGDLEWLIIAFSLFKSVLQAVCAYVLRRFLDPSSFPTPLPPAPVAEPADRQAGVTALELAAWVAAGCLVLLVLFAVFGTPSAD
jgi:amino acid transporter